MPVLPLQASKRPGFGCRLAPRSADGDERAKKTAVGPGRDVRDLVVRDLVGTYVRMAWRRPADLCRTPHWRNHFNPAKGSPATRDPFSGPRKGPNNFFIAVKERPQGDDRNEAMRWQWLYI